MNFKLCLLAFIPTAFAMQAAEGACNGISKGFGSLEKALLRAIQTHNIESIHGSITAGADINYLYKHGTNPLMEAALSGNVHVFELVRKNGAAALTIEQQTKLVQLSKTKKIDAPQAHKARIELINRLMTLRPSARQKNLELLSKDKEKPVKKNKEEQLLVFVLSTQNELFNAVAHGRCAQAREIVARLQDFHHLHEYILAIPRSLLYRQKQLVVTPLQLAALAGDELMVATLLDAGAPIPSFDDLPSDAITLIEKHEHRFAAHKKWWKEVLYERKKRQERIASAGKQGLLDASWKIVEAYATFVEEEEEGPPPYKKERIAYAIHHIKKFEDIDLRPDFPELPRLHA